MPFSLHRKPKSSPSSDVQTQSRPLMYAQSSYAPSIAESTATTIVDASTTARSSAETLRPSVNDRQLSSTSVPRESSEHVASTAFERPRTPVQASRSLPWESYSHLPPDHPVFRYPAEMREKMYAKGVDPVVKAEMDKAIRGKVYGDKTSPIKGFTGRAKGMICQWGTMSIGAF